MYIFTFYYPDTDAFAPACINVAGVFNRHLGICCIQTARVFMVKSLAGTNEYFPERPVFAMRFGFHT